MDINVGVIPMAQVGVEIAHFFPKNVFKITHFWAKKNSKLPNLGRKFFSKITKIDINVGVGLPGFRRRPSRSAASVPESPAAEWHRSRGWGSPSSGSCSWGRFYETVLAKIYGRKLIGSIVCT
jgi:hypothetical protein